MIKFIITMFITTSVFACNLTQTEKDTKASNGYWEKNSKFLEARNWINENEQLLKELGYPNEDYNLANGY